MLDLKEIEAVFKRALASEAGHKVVDIVANDLADKLLDKTPPGLHAAGRAIATRYIAKLDAKIDAEAHAAGAAK